MTPDLLLEHFQLPLDLLQFLYEVLGLVHVALVLEHPDLFLREVQLFLELLLLVLQFVAVDLVLLGQLLLSGKENKQMSPRTNCQLAIQYHLKLLKTLAEK